MRVTTHSLRHSTVALLRDRGVSEEQIATRLGHASTSTTALYGGDLVRDVGDDELPT
jgi:integrase